MDISSEIELEGMSESQNHVAPDSGPDILEQIKWVVSQAGTQEQHLRWEAMYHSR